MFNALQCSLEGEKIAIRFERPPLDLAAYVAVVLLELCAREEPTYGADTRAITLPFAVAARKRADPSPFARYLVGWLDRAGSLVWNPDAVSFAATFGVAAGSDSAPQIRPFATRCAVRSTWP
jgi:hypothetical protein